MTECKMCSRARECGPNGMCIDCDYAFFRGVAEAIESPTPSGQDGFDLLGAILKETNAGLELASSQAAAEVMGGNIVKENYWRGEMTALQRIRSIFESTGT